MCGAINDILAVRFPVLFVLLALSVYKVKMYFLFSSEKVKYVLMSL